MGGSSQEWVKEEEAWCDNDGRDRDRDRELGDGGEQRRRALRGGRNKKTRDVKRERQSDDR